MDSRRRSVSPERVWKVVSTAAGVVGGLLAQRLLRKGFEVIRGDSGAASPFDPTSDEFSWPDVLVWAVAGGIGLGVAKVISNRVAVLSWEAITGTPPPGVVEAATVSDSSGQSI